MSRQRAGSRMRSCVAVVTAVGFAASVVGVMQVSAQAAAAPVTITVLTPNVPAIQGAVFASAKRIPKSLGIKVVPIAASYVVTYQKATSSFASNTGAYDVVVMDNKWTGEWGDAGFLQPLNTLVDRTPAVDVKDFTSKFWKYCQWTVHGRSEQLCLPLNSEAHILFYRKDLFAAAHLSPPTTWAQLIRDAKFFTHNPKFKHVYGLSMPTDVNQSAGIFDDIYWNEFGQSTPAHPNGLWNLHHQDVFNPTAAAKTLKTIKQLIGYEPPGSAGLNDSDAGELFLKGETAMTIAWPSYLGALISKPADSQVVGKVGALPIPGLKSNAGGWGVAMAAGLPPAVQTAAWRYMVWLTSPANDAWDYIHEGTLPSRITTYSNPKAVASQFFTTGLKETVAHAVTIGRLPNMPLLLQGPFSIAIASYLTGQAALPATLTHMNQDIKAFLARDNY